eukprot:scaffold5617_cov70-Cylindrotheca_fusiformis.AAC.2
MVASHHGSNSTSMKLRTAVVASLESKVTIIEIIIYDDEPVCEKNNSCNPTSAISAEFTLAKPSTFELAISLSDERERVATPKNSEPDFLQDPDSKFICWALEFDSLISVEILVVGWYLGGRRHRRQKVNVLVNPAIPTLPEDDEDTSGLLYSNSRLRSAVVDEAVEASFQQFSVQQAVLLPVIPFIRRCNDAAT